MEAWDIKLIYGDIIEEASTGNYDVVLHGSNCQNAMGAGVAKAIRAKWPEAYQADLKTKKGDKKKLGTYSSAEVDGLTIANLYIQEFYGNRKDKVYVDYFAVEDAMSKIKEDFSGKRILMPAIGTGLARGEWIAIRKIIHKTLEGEDVTVILLGDPPKER